MNTHLTEQQISKWIAGACTAEEFHLELFFPAARETDRDRVFHGNVSLSFFGSSQITQFSVSPNRERRPASVPTHGRTCHGGS